jgi:hypothetical protein
VVVSVAAVAAAAAVVVATAIAAEGKRLVVVCKGIHTGIAA